MSYRDDSHDDDRVFEQIMKSPLTLKSLIMIGLSMVSIHSFAYNHYDDHGSRYKHQQRYEHRQQIKQHIKERVQYRAAQRHVAYHQWRRGEYLPVAYHSPRYVVSDWRAYRLSAPPRGHEWLRINGRFVQVSVGDHRISRLW